MGYELRKRYEYQKRKKNLFVGKSALIFIDLHKKCAHTHKQPSIELRYAILMV